jgi:hypothetical protein
MFYELTADSLTFHLTYNKAGKKFPLEVVAGPISDEDMLKYDKVASSAPYKATAGGSMVAAAEPATDELESRLFEKYVKTVNGKPLAEVSSKIPQPVKTALIQKGYGDVWIDTVSAEKEYSLEDLSDNVVEIKTVVNGDLVILKHTMKEPTAEQELEFKRASKVKTMGGRRGTQFSLLMDCTIYKRLYDRLVIAAEGYSLKEQPVKDNLTQDILDRIPYVHKKVVIRALFGTATDDSEEELGE